MSRSFCTAAMLLLAGCSLEPGEETLTVSGLVLSAATGEPIPDARVELMHREPFSAWNEGVRIGTADTDSEGRYAIVLAPPRTDQIGNCSLLSLLALAPGYLQTLPQFVGGVEDSCNEGMAVANPIRLLPVDGFE